MQDMQQLAQRTPFVIGGDPATCNPSRHTAESVFQGMRAAIQYKCQRDDFSNTHVAAQGLGKVGTQLCDLLHEAGAQLTVFDLDANKIEALCQRIPEARSVNKPSDIYCCDCDVFAPCGFGGILNSRSISMIKAPIIAGSANNQLAHHHIARSLRDHGKLYVPDFLLNSGGLIYAAAMIDRHDSSSVRDKIDALYDTCLALFHQADKEDHPTTYIAEDIAWARLRAMKPIHP